MALVSLETIKKETMWVARFPGCRFVGTYDQIQKYSKDPDCKDCDVVCGEGQPEHLQPFWKDYEEYTEKSGFLTIDQFYPIWEQMRTGPGDEPIPQSTKTYLKRFIK